MIVAGLGGLPVQQGQEIDFRFSAVERSDQRLNHRCRAVKTARVSPGFQFVRLRNVPVAQRRCFVFINTQAHAERHLRQNCFEVQICGRVINRVAAQNQKCRHASGANVRGQLTDGIPLIRGRDVDWLREKESLAHIAQSLIDGVSQRVHHGRLLISDHN